MPMELGKKGSLKQGYKNR